jgi:hypothetical protein
MLHGQWPAMLVLALARKLPPPFVAGPRIHLGPFFEVDVGALEEVEEAPFEAAEPTGFSTEDGPEDGGVATAVWAPPRPTLTLLTGPPEQDEYEVRVYDTREGRRLVAAVEIVSPANKDRPEHRRAFVAKCAALLRRRVSVSIVDVVTVRRPNLYGELLEWVGHSDPGLGAEPPHLYAATCRWTGLGERWRLETWAHALELGRPLPTLPLWLADDLSVPLELEATYEETCRALRIP